MTCINNAYKAPFLNGRALCRLSEHSECSSLVPTSRSVQELVYINTFMHMIALNNPQLPGSIPNLPSSCATAAFEKTREIERPLSPSLVTETERVAPRYIVLRATQPPKP